MGRSAAYAVPRSWIPPVEGSLCGPMWLMKYLGIVDHQE